MTKNQIDEIVLVGGSSRIPKFQQLVKEFFEGKELNKSINPDEAEAYGASILAAIKTNVKDENIERSSLIDVSNFSLGIETLGGVMNVFIPRNSSIPKTKTDTIKTSADNQTKALIQIYEGERQLTKDNYKLGQLILDAFQKCQKNKQK